MASKRGHTLLKASLNHSLANSSSNQRESSPFIMPSALYQSCKEIQMQGRLDKLSIHDAEARRARPHRTTTAGSKSHISFSSGSRVPIPSRAEPDVVDLCSDKEQPSRKRHRLNDCARAMSKASFISDQQSPIDNAPEPSTRGRSTTLVREDDTITIASSGEDEDQPDDDEQLRIVEALMRDSTLGLEIKDLQLRLRKGNKIRKIQEKTTFNYEMKARNSGSAQEFVRKASSWGVTVTQGPRKGKKLDVKAGMNLMLPDGNICHVIRVYVKLGDRPVFRGFLLCPTRKLAPLMSSRDNEFYLHTEVVPDGSSMRSLNYIDVSPAQVLGQSHDVKFTNVPFKRERDGMSCNLNCRWKYVKVFLDEKKVRVRSLEIMACVESDLRSIDAGSKNFQPNDVLRLDSGQKGSLGGSYNPKEDPDADIVEIQPSPERVHHERFNRGQQYEMVDTFCGCGGATAGAMAAGIRVSLACDMEPDMCKSYRRAFPGVLVQQETIDLFIRRYQEPERRTDQEPDWRTDIVHVSFPCQIYSPAHTIPSEERDDRNEAASYVLDGLVNAFRPRIVTIENTKGLLERHFVKMCLILGQLTDSGYSIRFGILNSADFGVPQARERLVVVASGPGNPRPHLPPPKYERGGRGGLDKWVSMNEAIDEIAAGAPDHERWGLQYPAEKRRPPRDGRVPAKTITCKGGSNCHPSGERPLTVRELAVLQTFDERHPFPAGLSRTRLVQQIGNAVPPLLMRAVCDEIRACLHAFDLNEWHDNLAAEGKKTGKTAESAIPIEE